MYSNIGKIIVLKINDDLNIDDVINNLPKLIVNSQYSIVSKKYFHEIIDNLNVYSIGKITKTTISPHKFNCIIRNKIRNM